MIFRIKGTQIELNETMQEIVEGKLKSLDRYEPRIISIEVEVGITTKHHQRGAIYFAEANVKIPGSLLRARHTATDLYSALDRVREVLQRELKSKKGKRIAKKRSPGIKP